MNVRDVALAATILFPLTAGSQDPPPAWVSEAREKTGLLGSQLIATLKDALTEQGAAGGIRVCNVEAPKIAARVSGNRFDVGRTALRIRNPDNAPDDWEESVLHRFEASMKQGADPAGLEAWQIETIVDIGGNNSDGDRVGRYMKAIPTGPQCLACHGESIAPDLEATIDRLYPEDQATGFSPGDLRGAFTVTVELTD